MPRIAVLQMTSGIDPDANFQTISNAAREACEGGAEMLFAPEMALLLDRNRERAGRHIDSDAAQEWPERLANVAGENGIYLVVGAPVAGSGEKRVNRLWFCPPSGEQPFAYDKMHMFDVDLASGESWKESNAYEAGSAVGVCDDTPVGKLGLAICYDMRFPALFEALGRRHCDCIAIPAAFTRPTGAAHWHVLLRARAIEASAFVVAAAQVGTHEDGRQTYGHSLVVDPWGEVLLDMGGNEPGLGFVNIDLNRIEAVRRQVPSLANRRDIPS
ncbi:carbon-nitrogen hydrolase family protein [Qipengyuania atrilutea]|uniref:Carbon-nitrogen hydrolase family protein n=1 Tax=Qipengyuania atrilutea TaxID=2744473 RepID=A0A850GZE5_9SPHN|nr:carbon-nitrogen hydrolase family protein [Actirhodobacter atriluteus]NVD43856.1 carbon-nitrogen hydrolase family protein [Actirhodobacter atriluteus]